MKKFHPRAKRVSCLAPAQRGESSGADASHQRGGRLLAWGRSIAASPELDGAEAPVGDFDEIVEIVAVTPPLSAIRLRRRSKGD